MQSVPDVHQWEPLVLSEYEVGRAVAAIEAVSRSDKPLAEVGCRDAPDGDLKSDLEGCLKLVRGAHSVRYWTKPSKGDGCRFGFYKLPWALDALAFLERVDLDETDRAWISGLLFGYHPRAIQEYIGRQAARQPRPKVVTSG